MTGLASSLGFNQVTDWLDPRRRTILGFAAGLAGGQTPQQGIAMGLQGAAQGREADDAYATQMKAEAERQQQITDAAALKDKYSQWFMEQGQPQIAQGIADGIVEPGKAYWDFIQPKAEPDYPTSYDEFLLGQKNPEYAATLNQPGQVINNNIGGTDKFYDELDKGLAGQTTAAIESGMNAQSNNIRLGQLETLLQSAPQGAQGAMVQVAGSLGIPVEGLDDVQAAQALINQMVPGQRPPGSGTMSDADLALFKQSLPQIINQPGGNQLILQTMKAINEYAIAQAQIAQKVANREISPAEGRSLQAQVPNPLANLPRPTMAPAQPRLRFNPATGDFE